MLLSFFSVSSRLIFLLFFLFLFFSSGKSLPAALPEQLVQFSVMLFFSVDSQLFPAFIFLFLYTELVVHFLHYGFFDFSREIFIIFPYRLGNQTVQKQLKPCPLILYIPASGFRQLLLYVAGGLAVFSERNPEE